MKEYFSKPGISNSSLRYINPEEGGSPYSFYNFIHNIDRQTEESISLERGSLIHLYCENKDAFVTMEIDKPAETIGEIADLVVATLKGKIFTEEDFQEECLKAARLLKWNPRYGDDAIKKNICDKIKPYVTERLKPENDHKLSISKSTRYVVENCIDSLRKNPIVQKLLFENNEFAEIEYYNEAELYMEYSVSVNGENVPLKLKGMLDRLIIDHESKTVLVPDIKSLSKSRVLFQNSFEYWHYYRQHAFYWFLLKNWLGKRNINTLEYSFHFYNIVVETVKPFGVAVVPISPYWLRLGMNEMEDLLYRVAYHKYYNEWNLTMEEHQSGGYLFLKDEKIYS